jgi:hypothetical protein
MDQRSPPTREEGYHVIEGVVKTFFGEAARSRQGVSGNPLSRAAGASGVLESLSFLSFSFPGNRHRVGLMWLFVRSPLYAVIWALGIVMILLSTSLVAIASLVAARLTKMHEGG